MGGGGVSGGMGRSSGGGTSPLMMALMALLSSGALSGSGGLGGLLGGLTGGGESPGDREGRRGDGRRGRRSEAETSGGGALGGLLESLTRSGHGDVADSWVGTGSNRRIEPDQLDNALGRDTIDRLQRQTGMERGDLLSQLSDVLPDVVDKLTPHGRRPNPDEMSRW